MSKAKKSKTKKTIGVAGKRAKTFPRKKKAAKKPRMGVVNVKLTRATRKQLEERAKKFADGNLSAYLRYTGLRYTPVKGEKFKVIL